LFRGRYKAILIEVDNYLLQVSRYIHLNPVQAKILERPEDYQWSSYCAYLGVEESHQCIHTQFILDQMNDAQPQLKYCMFVQEGIDEELEGFYENSRHLSVLGTQTFIDDKIGKVTPCISGSVCARY
jgi:putative transposase